MRAARLRIWTAISLAMVAGACAGPQTGLVMFTGAGQIRIRGLDTCNYKSPGRVSVDPDRPLVVLVHGCNDSGGRFRVLADVFEAQGQQTICFNYDDRDRLEVSSAELQDALGSLMGRMRATEITVVGHSQGGLVSRRALVADRKDRLKNDHGVTVRLVTVSSPLGGIQASSHCGILALHILSFGAVAGICQIAAGSKWTEIHPVSWFMVTPGGLLPSVQSHLKVITDERDFCLTRDEDGECAESDDVFSLAEQYNPVIDADPRVTSQVVRAGHVEIVGDEGKPPLKLVEVLQQHGVMKAPVAEERGTFDRKLAKIYGALSD